MLKFFNSKNQCPQFLAQLASKTIDKASSIHTLFRGDDATTRCIRNYFKLTANHYLQKTLGELVHTVIKEAGDCEIDPSRLLDKKSLAENTQRLKTWCRTFLTTICNSLAELPKNIRLFLQLLKDLIHQKYPNHSLQTVGSLFFLRFISPAICCPEEANLTFSKCQLTSEARRALVLIAKVLQTCANGSSTATEDFMKPLDKFVLSQQSQLSRFYHKLTTVPSYGPPESCNPHLTNEEEIMLMCVFSREICDNFEMFQSNLKHDLQVSKSSDAQLSLIDQFLKLIKEVE